VKVEDSCAADWHVIYPDGWNKLQSGGIDWMDGCIKIMLCSRDYYPRDADHVRHDIKLFESSGPGYRRGGKELTVKTITREMGPDGPLIVFDAADAVWHNTTSDARRAVVYEDTGDGRTSTLLCCLSFDHAPYVNAGVLTVAWSPAGVMRVREKGEPPAIQVR
jgi:hypothetical protein